MDGLRRGALNMVLSSLLVLTACFGHEDKPDFLRDRSNVQGMSDVVVSNLNPPGAASVTNQGPDVALRRNVVVEKRVGTSWTAAVADVRLITNCDDVGTSPTRVLHRGETLTLKTWNGWSCDGQCARSCRANVYLGPGEFRFVVVPANGEPRSAGAGFVLGAQGKR